MAKYFDQSIVDQLGAASKEIVAIRNRMLALTNIDILDTDAISSVFIYEVVKQYDSNYNINFARNGEDAKSGTVIIEQKSTRIKSPLTKSGKPRKGAGSEAAFQFHAHGELDYPRYIFAARSHESLDIVRIYDIQEESNRQLVLDHLLEERRKWDARCLLDEKNKKRDIIILPEKYIQERMKFQPVETINNCLVMRDTK